MDKANILLVEDEEFIRDIYKRQLEKAGFAVTTASKGQEAIKTSREKKFNLILLDIMLPDTNGLEVLKQIKANPDTKETPVVMLTNLGQDEVIKEGFSLGAQGYFIKASYTPDQIVQEVKNIISKTSAS